MRFNTATSPHTTPASSVDQVMRKVLIALIPGTIACAWFFGWGVLINIGIACIVALLCEAAMLTVRGKAIKPYLMDNSAHFRNWNFFRISNFSIIIRES